MRVLYVTSEVFPLAKVGGLADVSAALPASLRDQGIDVQLLMPGYPSAMDGAGKLRLATVIDNPSGVGHMRIWKGTVPGSRVPVWLLDCKSLYCRDGNPYCDGEGHDFPDNALRFGLLSYIGAMIATHSIGMSWRPDLIHLNDWQTALLPTMLGLQAAPHPPTLLAIHNLAYQGLFPAESLRRLPVPAGGRTLARAEGDNRVSFLETGLATADRVVTVSPTYASEIQTHEYGCGLDDLLRKLCLPVRGILNGVDYRTWDPLEDPYLATNYGPAGLSNKRSCKADVQQALGLDVRPDAPLIAFMSRLTWQKMPETVVEIMPVLLAEGIQFGLVAEGDPAYEAAFRDLAAAYPGQVGVHIGYEEPLAHRLVAGADVMLCPARYEPCGLTAVYAMRYGTPPLTRRTGGLVDTIVDVRPQTLADDTATGFLFDDASAAGMISCVRRALRTMRQTATWRRIQVAGMLRDFSWMRSAGEYAGLYRQMLRAARNERSVLTSESGWSNAPGRAAQFPSQAAETQLWPGTDDLGADRAELVRQRAYEIWEREGRPEGRHVEHWLQAEAELTQERPAAVVVAAQAGDDNELVVLRKRKRKPAPQRVVEADEDAIAGLRVAS